MIKPEQLKVGMKVKLKSTTHTEDEWGLNDSMAEAGDYIIIKSIISSEEVLASFAGGPTYHYSIADLSLKKSKEIIAEMEIARKYFEGNILENKTGDLFQVNGDIGKPLDKLSKLKGLFLKEDPEPLSVDTLDNPLKIKGLDLIVGCQTINYKDAIKIAQYINKNFKPVRRRKKK